MPEVTGSIRNAAMSATALGQPRVVFYFPDPQLNMILAPGRVTPTDPVYVAPDSEGQFSVNLISTDDMLSPTAHYKMRIEWISKGLVEHVMDFPDWEIRVPSAGGSLDDLTTGALGSWWNQRIVWAGLTAPPIKFKGTWWLLSDPANPDNPDVSHPSWAPSWKSGDLLEWE